MDKQELLVHYTASSRLHDDRKFQSLADELRNFEVATVTPVYGFVGISNKRNGSCASNDANLSFSTTTTMHSPPVRRSSKASQVAADLRVEVLAASSATCQTQLSTTKSIQYAGSMDRFLNETPLQRQGRTKTPEVYGGGPPHMRRFGQWPVNKGQVTRIRVSTQQPMNPQYKNPFHGKKPAEIAIQALQTPVLVRPKTAPANSTGIVLVPLTKSVTHKRSASDSFSDTSFPSGITISDSQFSMSNPTRQVLDSQEAPGRQRTATELPDMCAVIDVTPDLQPHKRRRLTATDNTDVATEDAAEAGPISRSPVDSSFERKYLMRRPPRYEGPYFLRERSEDSTSPPQPSASDSSSNAVSSTLFPSQPTSAPTALSIYLVSNSPLEVRADRRKTAMGRTYSPILSRTRSSPRLPSYLFESSPKCVTRSFYNGSPHASPSHQGYSGFSTGSLPTGSSKRYDPTSNIRSLPDSIQAPLPPVGSGSFTTHVSRDLSTIVARLPLTKYFRPVFVARNVHVLERGFWSIRVRIAGNKDVAEARRPYNQEELLAALNREMSGATSEERIARYDKWKEAGSEASELGLSKRQDLWTEAEFLDFWEVLKKFVEESKAGNHLSAAKDWAEEAVTPGRSTQSTYARIRVYTWGEVVGHVWIALWVLSDKKIAYVPMDWIAADDSVIVKMSGNRHRAGKLGPWVPKGSPGGKGSWGVEAGTPPGNQGKYVHFPSS